MRWLVETSRVVPLLHFCMPFVSILELELVHISSTLLPRFRSFLISFVLLSFLSISMIYSWISFLPKDEKIQDVLGHFQKDFEGGVSAENLGKF